MLGKEDEHGQPMIFLEFLNSYEKAEVGCLRYGLGGKITPRPVRKPVKEHGVLLGSYLLSQHN